MTSLSESWFRPKAIELEGRLYEWLGVVPFKRVLMRLVRVDPERPTANAYVLGGRRPEDLLAFEERTRRSERIHLTGLAVAGLLLVLGIAGSRAVLFAGIVVLAANFHCFALQRYNRIRIHRVLVRAGRPARTPEALRRGVEP